MFFFSGIQQIGVGVSNVHEAFHWYKTHFGMDLPVFEEAATAKLMLPYTGGQPRDRHAILALNMQGGGGLEIWQYTCRNPVSSDFQPRLGDLGIHIAKVKCKDVAGCFQLLREKNAELLTEVTKCPDGRSHFYVNDPWGNTYEVLGSDCWFHKKAKALTGGMYGCVVGVSDIDRSIKFYQEILGYDIVVYDQTDSFGDWSALSTGQGRYRRVLLRHRDNRRGPFSSFFGKSEIELVQTLDREPRKIFENRFWGDLGYIHLCFDVVHMDSLREFCTQKGHPFTVDSSGTFDMGEAAGSFAYIEDPDGTLIEFVETHRIPLIKKIGWYLDLRKRKDRTKPLPKLFFSAMGLSRVK